MEPEHYECRFRRTDVRNTIQVVNLRFVICYPVVIFIQRNLFIIALEKDVIRFGVGRLRMLYKTNILLFVLSWPFERCGQVSKKPDFFLVKLKNQLYIRRDGVLNVFLN